MKGQNLDKNRLGAMATVAIREGDDPRFDAILVPAAKAPAEPWEHLARFLVEGVIPSPAKVPPDTWRFACGVFAETALSFVSGKHGGQLIDLYRNRELLRRIMRIAMLPTALPRDRESEPWKTGLGGAVARLEVFLALAIDPEAPGMLDGSSTEVLDGLKTLHPRDGFEMCQAIFIAVAEGFVPQPSIDRRIAFFEELGEVVPGDRHPSDGTWNEKYFGPFKRLSHRQLQRLAAARCYGAAEYLGSRFHLLEVAHPVVRSAWVEGVWRSIPFVGVSDEGDFELLRSSDQVVRYAVYRAHANKISFDPTDPFHSESCDGLSFMLHRAGITERDRREPTYEEALEFARKMKAAAIS